MSVLLIPLLGLPLLACVLALALGSRGAQWATLGSSLCTLVLTAILAAPAAAGPLDLGSWVRVDSISEVFLLSVALVYVMAAAFSIGYLRAEEQQAGFHRYARLFYAGINLFAWSMFLVLTINDLALIWVGVEITTIVSALLVAIEDTDEASEAAWKYIVIASAGLAIGLLGVVFVYAAGSTVFGPAYEPFTTRLIAVASQLPSTPVKIAYVLAVIGFGTKMGLVPLHTWLPDAHSEAPSPVSAMLSGGLLVVSFYAILRFHQIAVGALGPSFAQHVLLVFGVLTLVLAALYVLSQQNIKRLLAYSSVEHMGIIAVGTAFGTRIALIGVFIHVLAHAAAKGVAFLGAGTYMRKFGTKSLDTIRGGLHALPWSAPLFLAAVLGLSALPPFGIFRSEFLIVQGGLDGGRNWAVVVLVVLVTVAFIGIAGYANRISVEPGPAEIARGEISAWMVAPMVLGIVVLLLLGLHPPAGLQHLFEQAAAALGSSR